MCHTVIYKGWVCVQPPRRGKDQTVILAPNRFFYRPKNNVIAEKIARDIYEHGPYVNMSMWVCYYKTKPKKETLTNSFMGFASANYSEIYDANSYKYTQDYINMGSCDFLEELAKCYHHYCIIEVTYHKNEYDMISHEMELILLLNRS